MSRIGIYPSESQLLLLKSIVYPADQAILFWDQWKAGFRNSFSSAEAMLDAQDENIRRLLSLAYFNLQQYEDEWIGWIKGYARHAWARQQKLQHEANRVYSFFQINGLQPVLLKGLAMSRSSHKIMAFRVMNDLDFYVPVSSRNKAFTLLNELGYQILATDEAILPVSHAAQFKNGNQMEIDMHWNLFQEHLYPSADLPFLKGIEKVDFHGIECQKLNSTAQFFHSLYQCSHWDEMPNIRWVVDCVLIARTGNVDWDEVILWTEDLSFQSFMADALRFLKDEFDVNVPDYVPKRILDQVRNKHAEKYFRLVVLPRNVRVDRAILKIWYKWKAFPNPDNQPKFLKILGLRLYGKWCRNWYRIMPKKKSFTMMAIL